MLLSRRTHTRTRTKPSSREGKQYEIIMLLLHRARVIIIRVHGKQRGVCVVVRRSSTRYYDRRAITNSVFFSRAKVNSSRLAHGQRRVHAVDGTRRAGRLWIHDRDRRRTGRGRFVSRRCVPYPPPAKTTCAADERRRGPVILHPRFEATDTGPWRWWWRVFFAAKRFSSRRRVPVLCAGETAMFRNQKQWKHVFECLTTFSIFISNK